MEVALGSSFLDGFDPEVLAVSLVVDTIVNPYIVTDQGLR